MRRSFVCAVVFSLLSITAASAGVVVDHDKSTDFSKFKTYAWKPGTPASSPLNETRVHTAIETQLAQKGLKKVEGDADCYVYSHVKTAAQQQVDIDTFGYGGYHGWSGWGGGWGTTSVNVQNVVEGTLIVDIVSAETKQLAWRGMATKTVFPDIKPEKLEKIIQKSVTQMFAKFPPPVKKK